MYNRFDSKVNLISLFDIGGHYLSVDILSLPPTIEWLVVVESEGEVEG